MGVDEEVVGIVAVEVVGNHLPTTKIIVLLLLNVEIRTINNRVATRLFRFSSHSSSTITTVNHLLHLNICSNNSNIHHNHHHNSSSSNMLNIMATLNNNRDTHLDTKVRNPECNLRRFIVGGVSTAYFDCSCEQHYVIHSYQLFRAILKIAVEYFPYA